MSAINDWNEFRTLYDGDFEEFCNRFLGSACPLLRLARELRRDPKEFRKLLDQGRDHLLRIFSTRRADPALLTARELLIQAAIEDLPVPDISDRIHRAVAVYREKWWLPDELPVNRGQLAEPPLPAARPGWSRRIEPKFVEVFETLADQLPAGWRDPALNMAGETVSWIWRDDDPWTSPVTTWLLLAVKHAGRRMDGGVAAQLQVWKAHSGTGQGFLYPHPLTNGYVATKGSFQHALQNAWWVEVRPYLPGGNAGGRGERSINFDLCWSVELQSVPRLSPLAGRSGEAALACALRAVRQGDPLDENVAVTAQLAAPGQNGLLAPVSGVLDKLLANEFRPDLGRRRIFEIVVQRDQPESGQAFDNGRLKVQPVTDVDAAYERLSRWARLTRDANRSIARTAREDLRKACDGPYIHSHLSERRENTVRSPDAAEEDLFQRLSSRQRKLLLTGTTTAKRVRIFADSASGKTVLLQYWERKLAAADSGRVPIRLINLSAIPWSHEEAFLAFLANQMKTHLPDEKSKTRVEWLQTLRDRGRLVFLLDALDQTTDLGPLHAWLVQQGGGVQDCPVVITGRQHVERGTRAAVFDGADWQTLRVDLFEERQQRRFLGPKLARMLLSANDDWPTDWAVRRKGAWAPLCAVPLLLRMLRDLARDGRLEAFPNRERLYQQTLVGQETTTQRDAVGLIGKGLTTTRGHQFDGAVEIADVVEFLGRYAWAAFTEQGFTGQIGVSTQGACFDGTRRILKADLQRQQAPASVSEVFGLLTQVNVLTKNSLLDGQEGFAWRHLSFGEFFAGIHLAENLNEDQQTALIRRVHDRLAARAADNLSDPDAPQRSPVGQWEQIFRFALCRAHANGDDRVRDHLSRQLIAHGNPYVVYDALHYDQVHIDPRLDGLCRWLVHQTKGPTKGGKDYRDYREAWSADQRLPETDRETLTILDTLFNRRYRNGPVLPPAWTLLERALRVPQISGQAQSIQQNLYTDVTRSPSDDNPGLDAREHEVLQRFLDSFRPCPPDDLPEEKFGEHFRPGAEPGTYLFQMGASPGDDDAVDDEKPRRAVVVRAFGLSEFCVTNEEWELLDPSHFWRRDRFSRHDDQPAVYVNWYMADFFGRVWLAENAAHLPGRARKQYGLPTECQWEFGARGGTATGYWWGHEFDKGRCNGHEYGIGRPLGRRETTDAYRNAFGLRHMLGNTWEWCSDWYQRQPSPQDKGNGGPSAGTSRVLRGGAFYRTLAHECRVSHRGDLGPDDVREYLGFRVVVSLVGASRPPG